MPNAAALLKYSLDGPMGAGRQHHEVGWEANGGWKEDRGAGAEAEAG